MLFLQTNSGVPPMPLIAFKNTLYSTN